MIQNNPKVSIIIPVYNAEKHLRECLDSVLNQTLKDIEVICVDDGSTDGSLAILREYEAKDHRIRIITQKNQFAGVARNHGMEIASGQYYAFMDSDDCYLPDAIEKMFKYSEQYELDFIKACFYNLEPEKKPYDDKYSLNGYVSRNAFYKVLSFPKDLSALNYIADVPWNGLYRASFLKKHGIAFNTFRVINDHSFFVSCMIHAERAMVIKDHIAYHRTNQASSLVGTKQKYYQCQIDNYFLVQQIVQGVEWAQRRQLLQRELDGVLHWYSKLYPDADPYYKEQMDRLLHSFISEFDESDVGIQHLLTMNHRELYYHVKSELLGEHTDPVFPCAVSMIIPVYNTERYLDECLTSICGQTFRDIEIICVDDKSTDNSLSVLKCWAERDSRIKVVAQKENSNQGGARNAGLDIARGKYVWFIDSDDVIDTNAVEFLVKQMESLADVDLITFNADAFQEINGKKRPAETGVITRKWPKNRKLYLPQDADDIPAMIDGSCCTYFSKRSFIDGYRFRPHIFFEDACFAFSALTAPGVFYELEYSPYHRRIRENSSTSQNTELSEKCLKDRIIALQDISAVIKDRKLPRDHFGVRWFKSWAVHSIRQYWDRGLQDPGTDRGIEQLQMEWYLFHENSPLELLKCLRQDSFVVSLTSYPARINSVCRVIESIKKQTITPEKIILWLAKEEFPDGLESLPAELQSAVDDTFEIKWCQDLKPHKKYYNAMLEYPETIIITVDDDIYYPQDTIEKLLRSYIRFPYAVSAMRAHLITFDTEGNIAPYNEFVKENGTVGVPSYCLLATGVGGILYPPHCMHSELFNQEAIKALCLYADDLWLKTMQMLNGTPVVIASDSFPLQYVEDTQESALWKSNMSQNKNDEQLARILERYDCFLGEKDTITQRIRLACVSFKNIKPLENNQKNQREAEALRASWSYRIGRVITFVPRKVRGGVQCCRDHGAVYTVRRTLYHMGLWADEGAPKSPENRPKLVLHAERLLKGKRGNTK